MIKSTKHLYYRLSESHTNTQLLEIISINEADAKKPGYTQNFEGLKIDPRKKLIVKADISEDTYTVILEWLKETHSVVPSVNIINGEYMDYEAIVDWNPTPEINILSKRVSIRIHYWKSLHNGIYIKHNLVIYAEDIDGNIKSVTIASQKFSELLSIYNVAYIGRELFGLDTKIVGEQLICNGQVTWIEKLPELGNYNDLRSAIRRIINNLAGPGYIVFNRDEHYDEFELLYKDNIESADP